MEKDLKEEVLEVKYFGNNVFDVLEMNVDEAIAFFSSDKKSRQALLVAQRLQPLSDVGLGYVKLGQSSNTLSGGEAQRVKLASFWVKAHQMAVYFLFLMSLLQGCIFTI